MQLDTPNTIYTSPKNAFIADFIGESSLLSVKVANQTALLGETEVVVEHSVEKDGDYVLVVRPEKLFLATENSADTNFFNGIVEESIFQGESQLLVIRLDLKLHGDQMLRMRIPNGSATLQALPAIGDEIRIGLKKSDSFLVE